MKYGILIIVVIFCMGARSFIHRSDTLATNIYGYKNHAILIIKYIYISNNMADSWPLSVNIESRGNISSLQKLTLLLSMVKLA